MNNMKTRPLQSGFTLIELTISVGIFVVVFISMTQIFFLMQGTIARINAQREMVAWMTNVTQTMATDLESYAIVVQESDARTLTLQHVSDKGKIIYRQSEEQKDGQEEHVLTREVQNVLGNSTQTTLNTYTSPLFYFSDISMHVSPDRGNTLRCSILPSVTLHLTVAGMPGDSRLSNLHTEVQTTFSSNANPLSYSKTCLADPTKT